MKASKRWKQPDLDSAYRTLWLVCSTIRERWLHGRVDNAPKSRTGNLSGIIRVGLHKLDGSARTPRHATQMMLVSLVSSIGRPPGHASSEPSRNLEHAGGGWDRSIQCCPAECKETQEIER